ncbi:N-acetylmuramoyl-L-alanine amidase [Streptomyces antarcticus]|uniref:N-acetylmuramoyl-L-alanine amidase n=1 Tax=Streptomyces antarcticus TaxID=2996458 RepID=UPI00226D5DCA|nr:MULTISPECIES: N-acetylmuramoyl-L-alanine amidase [unclassified Streptomyces]MCY0946551.1 N-acetylmuramoyl-L-alanine amidase [Streptomyces sp. H34-AA3]MCZ4086105.1 N-acetylmuramoyl-L-alanine amidase [Streptomyces sp. H34-S5]
MAVLGFQGAANGLGTDPLEGIDYSAPNKAGDPVEGRMQKLALKEKGDDKAVLSQQDTKPFGLLGVSWRNPSAKLNGSIEARTRDAESGKWSKWISLEPVKAGLDGPRPGARGSTEPVWVGLSDGAEVRIGGEGGAELPDGLELNLVDPGTAKAKKSKKKGDDLAAAPVAFAAPAVDPPPVVEVPPSVPGPASTAPKPEVSSRVAWGADESLNDEGPTYLPDGKIKAVFVHHTTVATPYECAESAAMVRSLHVYHIKTNGWRDLGYNFLVDRCGNVFEGRQGGVDQPVNGAHTYGWNAESTGIAVLGDYTSVGASPEALAAVADIAAYKLGQYDGDINGTTTLVAGDTQKNYFGTQFTKGQSYTFKALSGHRDAFNTQCPGISLYPQLDSVRTSGPAAKLKIAKVNGVAAQPNASFETRGSLTVEWDTSTPGSRLTKFELLVDGKSVAITGGGARQASASLALGSHQVEVVATASNGKVATSLPVTVVAAVKDVKFVPVAPKRLMDTREGLGTPQGKVGEAREVNLQVAGGTTGIPADGVTAVALNVTATEPTRASYVSVFPAGASRASASNLNFTPGLTIPNMVIVPVNDGKVTFYNNAGDVHLLADITGYFTASGAGSTYVSYGPTRLMDSREGLGIPRQKIAGGQSATLQVAGVGGIPATGVKAVVLNVTATEPTQSSFVSVYPAGGTLPTASNLNFTAGRTIPNLVVVPVSADGKVSFYNRAGDVHLIADVTGYFSDSTAGSSHTNIGPRRLMDTREGLGVPGTLGGDNTVTLQVAGIEGVPATDVTAVILNVTATNPTQPSFVSVFPSGTTRPTASNLNVTAGQTIPNLVIVPVVDGKVSFYNRAGRVDLIADITGYFSK